MKITVIGATGQIGRQVIPLLTAEGHDVTGASRQTGVDAAIGSGLDEALRDADVVIDVLNSPTMEDDAALAFFTATSSNLTVAAKRAGVRHYVLLSIVGVDGLLGGGYLRGKVVQEKTVAASGLPYTIVRATQFHEFAEMIVGSLLVDGAIHAPNARIQPIAAAEVAAEVAEVAQTAPVNGIVDIGGPEKMGFDQLARILIERRGDDTAIVVDPAATYFGTPVGQDSLVTGRGALIVETTFRDWLAAQ